MLDVVVVCLAINIYFEARNQPVEGQVAVSQVVMNRVDDRRFPDDPCAVIKQGPRTPTGVPLLHQCQFSWYCDGKSDIPEDHDAYRWATIVALGIMTDRYTDRVRGATHYHADHIEPDWPIIKTKTAHIGNHIFYRWEPDT